MASFETSDRPISIQLADGESVTVPDDEVWRINVSVPVSLSTDISVNVTRSNFLRINGQSVASSSGGLRHTSFGVALNHSTSLPVEDVIVIGGDEISTQGSAMHIGGFVINEE